MPPRCSGRSSRRRDGKVAAPQGRQASFPTGGLRAMSGDVAEDAERRTVLAFGRNGDGRGQPRPSSVPHVSTRSSSVRRIRVRPSAQGRCRSDQTRRLPGCSSTAHYRHWPTIPTLPPTGRERPYRATVRRRGSRHRLVSGDRRSVPDGTFAPGETTGRRRSRVPLLSGWLDLAPSPPTSSGADPLVLLCSEGWQAPR
jgi:hypothetical protein